MHLDVIPSRSAPRSNVIRYYLICWLVQYSHGKENKYLQFFFINKHIMIIANNRHGNGQQ
jgi:hypothetical protein